MQVTHIRVVRGDSKAGGMIVALVAVFLLGMTLGSGLIIYKTGKLSFPTLNSKDQLGAVGLSDIRASTPTAVITSVPTEVSKASEAVTKGSQVEQNTRTVARTATGERADLTLRITDRTIAIDRVNQEIERTKNTSVALITAFDQNCGNWTDDCAKTYAAKLDESNTTYNELVLQLNSLSADLVSLQRQLESLSD